MYKVSNELNISFHIASAKQPPVKKLL